jgi:hypothetical protein
MAWFRVASNRLRYRGRVSQEPYTTWAGTSEGAATIEARARQDRLYVLPLRRARRRIWRELERASRSEHLREAIQSETDHFTAAAVAASHAPGLPRRTIAFHRLVIVPRTLIGARARTALHRRLFTSETLATLDPHVRDFFCEQVIVEIDAAVAESRPSVVRPVLTQDTWGCVGYNNDYRWVDPMFSGPGWGGHLVMFEFPREGVSRKTRKDVERAADELQSSLANLSRIQRDGIMRVAVDGLPRLTA